MAKIQIKSEKLSPFGGFFRVMEQFDSTLSSVIDSTLGLRCRLFGCFFIFLILFFLCIQLKFIPLHYLFKKQQNVINMKQKDVITGWLVAFIISCMMLAGCTEKSRKLEKKNVKVETISVGNTNLGGTKDYVGTIEEKMGSTLSFEIAGNITSIRVEEGDRVSKGQLLATINPTTVKEAHRATLTTLKQAQDAYRRFLPLHQSGTISDMKWVEIESKLEQAKAAESIARQQLSHSTLTAPFAGVIAAKNVDLGTYVLPGQPVLKLANVAQVNAKVSVPEAEISHLHVGDKVKLTVAALSGAIFRGTISEKGIDANPISHTYDVKVTITNPQGRLLPGMVCNAQVQGSAATPSHITVPPQSIELDADNSRFVWTVINGKAHQQPVTTGDFEGDGIVILSGLKAGDQVIINGQQKVSEGMNVDTAKSDNR